MADEIGNGRLRLAMDLALRLNSIRPPNGLPPFLLLFDFVPPMITEGAPLPLAPMNDVIRGPPDPYGTIL